jgi:hypothetical protein
MDNEGKQKRFTTGNNINTLAQVYVHIGTCIKLPSLLGLRASSKNYLAKPTERHYAQCGSFSNQQKLLKCSPQKEIEFVLAISFTQAHVYL